MAYKIGITASLCSLVFTLCTPRAVVQQGGAEQTTPQLTERTVADTVIYTLNFSDSSTREQFCGDFRSFLDKCRFKALRKNSDMRQAVIMIAPASQTETPSSFLSPIAPAWITESTIERHDSAGNLLQAGHDLSAPIVDTIIPEAGGKLRMHMLRSGIDGPFLELLAADQFSTGDSSASSLFTLAAPSPKKLTVRLNGKVIDGSGRIVSALDLIEAWTVLIKKNPAEGFALFRYVDGVLDFIQGKEAVVRGFGAIDQQTCYLKLTQPDPFALERIVTPRLCGIYSRLGPYYTVNNGMQEMQLLANRKTVAGRQPYLDTLILSSADDPNPILSFSLRKYDAITLTFLGDIAYARTTLEKQAQLHLVTSDRYFISCAIDDPAVRRYMASLVDAGGLLNATVKAEGATVAALESDSLPVAENGISDSGTVMTEKTAPPAGGVIRILFRKDDPVSRRIAEKLLADLTGNGVRSTLSGADVTDYERQLIERKYEFAVGWVNERVMTDRSEKLRLASIYFGDEASEQERIAGCRELPLFSVNRYLLMREPAGLYRERVGGVFAKSQPVVKTEQE